MKVFAVAWGVCGDEPLRQAIVQADDWFTALNSATEDQFQFIDDDEDQETARVQAWEDAEMEFIVTEVEAEMLDCVPRQ